MENIYIYFLDIFKIKYIYIYILLKQDLQYFLKIYLV